MAMDKNTRGQIVKFLTTNCECWRGDAETLNAMGDKQLQAQADLYNRAVTLDMVANAAGADGIALNEIPAFMKKKMKEAPAEDDEDDEEEMVAEEDDEEEEEEEYTGNSLSTDFRPTAFAKKRRKLSEKEWLAMAPPSVRNSIEFGKRALREKKESLVKRLVANISSDQTKVRKAKMLMNKEVGELEELVELMPPPSVTNEEKDDDLNFVFNGQNSPMMTENNRVPDESATLELPALNYEELSAERREGKGIRRSQTA